MTSDTVAAPNGTRSAAAIPAFAVTFLPLVAFLPNSDRAALAPRIAVGLVIGAIGLPLLVRSALRRDRVAICAGAFLGWALLSAVVAGAPNAWAGEYAQATGALFVLTLGAFWAIGTELIDDAALYAGFGFVAGAALNAVVAALQGPWELSAYSLPLYDARSTGLLGNPLFLGVSAAAGLALVPLVMRRRLPLGMGIAVLLAIAAQMSGGRLAVSLGVAATLWAASRLGLRRGGPLVVAVALGLAIGLVLPSHQADTGASRLTDPGSGLDSRVIFWRTGVRAMADRPLLGFGPGRVQAASGSRRTLEGARVDGPDKLYFDAHNIVVQYGITTGAVGLALLGAWVTLAVWAARRPDRPEFLAAAAVLFVNHLFEPQNVAMTPLMFLLLGAARPPPTPSRLRNFRLPQLVLGALALVTASTLLIGDVTLHNAKLSFDVGQVRLAERLLAPWAAPLQAETRIHVFRATAEDRSDALAEAVISARRAVARQPEDWRTNIELGGVLLLAKQPRAAASAYSGALRHNPWSQHALSGRARALTIMNRRNGAAACRRLIAMIDDETQNGSALRRSRSVCLSI